MKSITATKFCMLLLIAFASFSQLTNFIYGSDGQHSKFGHMHIDNTGEFVTDWCRGSNGMVSGEVIVRNDLLGRLHLVKFDNLNVKLPFHTIYQAEQHIVAGGTTDDGTVVVFESAGGLLTQVKSIRVNDDSPKILGHTSNSDEFICEIAGQLVILNWMTGNKNVLVDVLAAHASTFCGGADSFLFFPGATGECARINSLVRNVRPHGIICVPTTILPGLGGTSGSTPRGVAYARDDAIFELATFNRTTGMACAVVLQAGAGYALFCWDKDVLLDVCRLSEVERLYCLQQSGDVVKCILGLKGKVAELVCWKIDRNGLFLTKREKLNVSFSKASFDSRGNIVLLSELENSFHFLESEVKEDSPKPPAEK